MRTDNGRGLLQHLESRHWGTGATARIAAGVLVAGAIVLTILAATGRMPQADGQLLAALREPNDLSQTIGPHWLLNVFENVTSLGSSAVTGLVVALAAIASVALRHYRNALYVVLVFAGAQLLSNGIKVLVARARPDMVPHLAEAAGLSFPSGHSTLSAATYLALALMIADRRPALMEPALILTLALTPVALVGFSRLFLGVHFPTDVVAGWSIGGGWALVLWITFDAVRSCRSQRT